MGAHRLFDLLNPWRRRGAAVARTANADAAVAPSTFPIEAYNAALDRLVKIAFESGAREERQRIAAITSLPDADRFIRVALSLALCGVVSPEQAIAAFAAAERDMLARRPPTESSAPEGDARVLH